MTAKLSVRWMGALLLAGCGAAALGISPGVEAAAQKKDEQASLPGDALWDIKALEEHYIIVSTRFDAKRNEVVWMLETKQRMKARRIKACFLDANFVAVAEPDLRFTPGQEEYAKGARIQAVLKLPGRDTFEEANRVVLQSPR